MQGSVGLANLEDEGQEVSEFPCATERGVMYREEGAWNLSNCVMM